MNTSPISPTARKRAILFSLLPPVLGLLLFLFRGKITAFAEGASFPDCTFYCLTGFLCPGCGNTRAVLAILHGHFLQAFGYNPMIPILGLALLCLYVEQICLALGKRIRLLPRSNALLFTVLGVVLAYDILLRNLFPGITLCT